jgi:hypothetical protein
MQTDTHHIQCSQNHKKLIANQFSRSEVINCVGGAFHKGAGTPGTQRDIACSQLVMKGLISVTATENITKMREQNGCVMSCHNSQQI